MECWIYLGKDSGELWNVKKLGEFVEMSFEMLEIGEVSF